jgi:hypothetical protein
MSANPPDAPHVQRFVALADRAAGEAARVAAATSDTVLRGDLTRIAGHLERLRDSAARGELRSWAESGPLGVSRPLNEWGSDHPELGGLFGLVDELSDLHLGSWADEAPTAEKQAAREELLARRGGT